MDENRKRDLMKRKVKSIHFVGIGGIGMSGIAEVLLNLGYRISGSDQNESDITVRLTGLGARVCYGHSASHLIHADVVVTSTAIKPDNPEVVAAHERGIPVIPRAEMLAELLKMKFSIAVSGMHGKTTTTSMVSTVLANGGLDPTMVIGGKLASIGSNARLGNGEVIVAEADESDGSFLKLSPSIAVITNIDREHMDYYRDLDHIKDSFLQFANIVPFYGSTILCLDDPNVREILPRIKRRIISYGVEQPADYQAHHISFSGKSSRYELSYKGSGLGEITLNVPGLFNVYNSMAAIAVGRELDMSFADTVEGIKSFTGVDRRLEVKGNKNGVTVVDDYGHHPTEIRATLAAARQVWNGRLIVVFQPHRYTRTKALYEEFLGAFPDADVLIITDIYAASEPEIKGVHGSRLCSGIVEAGHPNAVYISGFDDIVNYLSDVARPGDVIITQGAGSVWKVGMSFLAAEPEKIKARG
ncbi:MAG: UDP-N-acetylmuramate--L-alanine ligase [Syntrophales bacterium]